MAADTSVLDIAGILTEDHHGSRTNDKCDSLQMRGQL